MLEAELEHVQTEKSLKQNLLKQLKEANSGKLALIKAKLKKKGKKKFDKID